MTPSQPHDDIFSRRPPTDESTYRYPIWRVHASKTARVIVLSHDLTGCYTHYWGGRTTPCLPDGCKACESDSARRWHAWLLTKHLDAAAIGILELTAKTVGPIDDFFRKHRTLRGAILTAKRVPAKPNGRIYVTMEEGGYDNKDLPKEIEVRRILAKMWESSYTTADRATTSVTNDPRDLKIAADTDRARRNGTAD